MKKETIAISLVMGALCATGAGIESICRKSLITALPSALGRIRHHAGDPSLAYYGLGESSHWSVQMSLQVVAGVDATTARKVSESASWDGKTLVFTGTDGLRREIAMDFTF